MKNPDTKKTPPKLPPKKSETLKKTNQTDAILSAFRDEKWKTLSDFSTLENHSAGTYTLHNEKASITLTYTNDSIKVTAQGSEEELKKMKKSLLDIIADKGENIQNQTLLSNLKNDIENVKVQKVELQEQLLQQLENLGKKLEQLKVLGWQENKKMPLLSQEMLNEFKIYINKGKLDGIKKLMDNVDEKLDVRLREEKEHKEKKQSDLKKLKEPKSEEKIVDDVIKAIDELKTPIDIVKEYSRQVKAKDAAKETAQKLLPEIEKLALEGKLTDKLRGEQAFYMSRFYAQKAVNSSEQRFKILTRFFTEEAVKKNNMEAIFNSSRYFNEGRNGYTVDIQQSAKQMVRVLSEGNDELKKGANEYLKKHSELQDAVNKILNPVLKKPEQSKTPPPPFSKEPLKLSKEVKFQKIEGPLTSQGWGVSRCLGATCLLLLPYEIAPSHIVTKKDAEKGQWLPSIAFSKKGMVIKFPEYKDENGEYQGKPKPLAHANNFQEALKNAGYKSAQVQVIDEENQYGKYSSGVVITDLNEVNDFMTKTCGLGEEDVNDLYTSYKVEPPNKKKLGK